MPTLQPNGTYAKRAIIAMWIMCLLEAVFLILGLFELFTVRILNRELDSFLDNFLLTGNLIFYLVYVIVFIFWFFCAYSNLHKLIADLKYKAGWAVGSWFVPVLNFFRPYRIMKELYQRTGEIIDRNGIKTEKLKFSPVKTWWTLWLVYWGLKLVFLLFLIFLYRSGIFIVSNTDMPETFQKNEIFKLSTRYTGVLFPAFGIFLTYITIKVVKNYSEVEPLLANCGKLKILHEELH
jgi:hypothetical protein